MTIYIFSICVKEKNYIYIYMGQSFRCTNASYLLSCNLWDYCFVFALSTLNTSIIKYIYIRTWRNVYQEWKRQFLIILILISLVNGIDLEEKVLLNLKLAFLGSTRHCNCKVKSGCLSPTLTWKLDMDGDCT